MTKHEELLRKLMTGFFDSGKGLEWSFNEGVTIGRAVGADVENQLRKYMEDSVEEAQPNDKTGSN